MKAFILAGGFATRLWPLTEARAKPLLPLAGKPIINYLVEGLPKDMSIALSTNDAFGTDFADWKQEFGFSNIEIVIEQAKNDDAKLGALGALAQWLQQENIQDDILLLTGDNYFGLPLSTLVDQFTNKAMLAAYDIQSITEASRYGTVLIKEGTGNLHTVTGFEEKPVEPKTTLVSTGAFIIPQSALPIVHEHAAVKPDDIGGLFEEFIQRKEHVECLTFTETWYDIGSFWAYLEAVQTLVPNTISSHKTATMVGSTQQGSVVLGKGSSVHNSHLDNVVVFNNCTINNCVLRDCIIDNDCVLTNVDLEGKMIRARTRLVNEVVQLPGITVN